MAASALHVLLPYFNPRRLQVRRRLFLETAKRLERDGAKVWRIEAAYGDRPHEVTSGWNCRHVQLRTASELWIKEAMLNVGARAAIEAGAEALAWVDADVQFLRRDWVSATLFALDHHPVVQLFSDAIDMTPKCGFMGRAHGFARLWCEGQRPGDFEKNKTKYPSHMHPGYGWAWRADIWLACGGMPACGILGSGDMHMATGLVGHAEAGVWEGVHPDYRAAVIAWGERAAKVTKRNVGFVEGIVAHNFHGWKEHRGYRSRVDILRQHQFSPKTDLRFDASGLPVLIGKPGLRDDIAAYFTARKEYDLTNALEAPR